MQKKQALVRGRIESAQHERGVLLLNTGNGKGKSSAAFGALARALGHGLRVGIRAMPGCTSRLIGRAEAALRARSAA